MPDLELHSEDGSSMVFRNVCILPHHCTVSKHRRSWRDSRFMRVGLQISWLSHQNIYLT